MRSNVNHRRTDNLSTNQFRDVYRNNPDLEVELMLLNDMLYELVDQFKAFKILAGLCLFIGAFCLIFLLNIWEYVC